MSEKVQSMFNLIADKYDLANDVLSFGIHRLWRKDALKKINPPINSHLDICTGSGDFLFVSNKILNPKELIGVDFSEGMLRNAKKRIQKSGLNAKVLQADALDLPFDDSSFELVTISFGIRNVDSIEKCLSEIHRVLKPGGKLIVIEFGEPENSIVNFFYKTYSKFLMPILGKIITGHIDPYKYLPETSLAFPCGNDFISYIKDANLCNTKYSRHFGGIAYSYFASKTN